MRDTLLTFLTTAITGTDFSVTQELPYNGDGAPLFLKNLVSQIKSARLDPAITGFQQKSTDVSTEYNTDRLVTEFVFNFTKLIVN